MQRQPKSSLRLNARLLPFVVAGLFIIQILAPYDGWLILLVGLSAAWLISYLWARSLARGLRLQREIRYGWAQVGDRLEERFTLKNMSSVPALWVEVLDETTMPGYQVSRATGVSSHSQNRWHTEGICTQRGLFRHGPTTIRSGDPLGIYSVEIRDPRATQLLVMPPIVPLPQIEIAMGGRAGEGRPRPDAPERTVSASTVRQYSPGDSLRWIHWRTTARQGQPFVRLFEGTPAGNWWIILDLDQKVQAGAGRSSTEEHAVILAASLADRGLRLRRPVGLAANGKDLVWLPPKEGEGQRWEILQSLALAAPGPRPLEDLLLRLRPDFGRRSSLIIITANTSAYWARELLPYQWSGSTPTVLLLDPASFGGAGSVQPALLALSRMGIACFVIPHDLFDRPEAHPGRRGKRDIRVSPSGRAVAVQGSQEENWKALG